jgi:hypothetical protein
MLTPMSQAVVTSVLQPITKSLHDGRVWNLCSESSLAWATCSELPQY